MKTIINLAALFTFCIIISCNYSNNSKEKATSIYPNSINNSQLDAIHILPLGKIDQSIIDNVSKGLNNFYHKKIIFDNPQNLDTALLTKSKKRYSASAILKKYKELKQTTLILIDKDISIKKDKIEEWGIFGLGLNPGKICVVSPLRPRWNSTPKLLNERMQKISIHEIGHNLGLKHCTNDPHCLMSAAKGTIKQVDLEKMFFCSTCKNAINL
jgi:archaemetzincin